MVDAEQARQLAAEDVHNVVRLILPTTEEPDLGRRYRRAAATLRDWQADGTLTRDTEPALYVYEQVAGASTQRGLIGALALPPDGISDATGPVLPHEDVAGPVVADRTALMRATRANLEPILLSYPGDGAASDVIDEVTERHHALLDLTAHDGVQHRLWAVTGAADLRTIGADLARHQALIADGHHRYAAYLGLRAEAGNADDLPGRDYGLAMVVDSRRHPLHVRAIHRVLPRLPLPEVLAALAARDAARVVETGPSTPGRGLDAALAALRDTPQDGFAALLADGQRAVLVTELAADLREAAPRDQPELWRHLDVTVLHYGLLHVMLGAAGHGPGSRHDGSPTGATRVADAATLDESVPEGTAGRIRFDHDAAHAVACAAETGGTAVLLRPVAERTVHELAAAGVRMPRKSTSFGPKPATGLVMRLLGDPVAVSPDEAARA
jgi:uncharacterized protein (DUF1015 family)